MSKSPYDRQDRLQDGHLRERNRSKPLSRSRPAEPLATPPPSTPLLPHGEQGETLRKAPGR